MKKDKYQILKEFEKNNQNCFKNLIKNINSKNYSFNNQNTSKCIICGDICYGLEYWIEALNKKALHESNFEEVFKDLILDKTNRNNLSVKLNDLIICKECIDKMKIFDFVNNEVKNTIGLIKSGSIKL